MNHEAKCFIHVSRCFWYTHITGEPCIFTVITAVETHLLSYYTWHFTQESFRKGMCWVYKLSLLNKKFASELTHLYLLGTKTT